LGGNDEYMKEQKRGKDFDKMLFEAIQEKYIFIAWLSINGIVEKCELGIKAFRKEYKEIELEISSGDNDQFLKIIPGNRVINIYIPELSVSFSSELKSFGLNKKIILSPPLNYSFHERRKHERVTPSKDCNLIFEHNKQLINKTLFDLSIGGAAIIFSKTGRINVVKGTVFTNATLIVGSRKIKVKLECTSAIGIDRFKLEQLPYGGFKFAFRFLEISKEDKAYLAGFVTHELLVQLDQKKAN
jgi:hypothetical protein